MRYKYWGGEDRTTVELALKLSEECGEVAGRVIKGHDDADVVEEIDHVIFIAQALREKLYPGGDPSWVKAPATRPYAAR